MKPFFQKLAPPPEQSVIFYEEEIPHFIVPWHYHPEIEILCVLKSTGTCYVGDSINNFTEGEICILGENVPHWWKSDDKFLVNTGELNTKALIIQFKKEIFDFHFINIPEMAQIKGLLERCQRGMQFTGNVRHMLGEKIKTLFDNKGVNRITDMILLLDIMANTKEYRYLSSIGYSKMINTFDFHRFNSIHEYIIHNFTKPIKLEEVADAVSMSPTAFCRYFKKRTGKTFFTFLNEFKVGHACKLLTEKKMSVSRTCVESGFNNLSHFNDLFKKIVKITPTEYQKAHAENDVFMMEIQ
jgi:AraC-like DNA-binding protein